MAFIPVGNTVQVELVFLQDSQRVQNVFHVNYTSQPDSSAINTLASDLKTWAETYLLPAQAANLSLISIAIGGMWDQNAEVLEYTTGLPITGGQTGDTPLPNNVTLAVKWITPFRGRSYRGRTYHLGLVQGYVEGNALNAAGIAALNSAYSELLDAVTAEGRVLCVVSKFTDGAPRTAGVATGITGYSVEPILDSQRRRLPGRGQ